MKEERIQMGSFITFEGIDGCGKSTQLRLLAEFLSIGTSIVTQRVQTTREPGGTEIAEKIRAVLLDPDNEKMTDRCEILLYLASRAQHVEELIVPWLNSDQIVLSDRFYDSTIAYQVYGREVVKLEQFERLNDFATGGLQPDLTFIFDIDVEIAFARMKDASRKADRLERLGTDFFNKLRRGFLELTRIFPERCVLVDANRPVETIAQEIRAIVQGSLEL